MKPFLLFLILCLAVAYFFGSEDISNQIALAEIARSPGYAEATVDNIIKSGRKKFTSYRVRYKFEVNGVEYWSMTSSTDEKGTVDYVSQLGTKVVYNTQNPSVNTLKRYYDLGQRTGTLTQLIIVVAVLSIGVALPLSLLLSWRFGWFRRKARV